VPPAPGLGSCVGLLVADVRVDAAATLLQTAGAFDAALVARRFAELAGDVSGRLEGAPAEGTPVLVRSLDCHYVGGGGELTVDLPAGPVDAALLDDGVRRFHAAHRERYGFAYDDGPVEVTTLRVTGFLRRHGADRPLTFSQPPPPTVRQGERRALLDPDRGPEMVPVLWRAELEAGFARPGPVLIDQYDTTTVVGRGHLVRVDDHGNLLITRGTS
jgi:N-methylhydantoinase A